MKRPSFIELARFLVTVSDQFPQEKLFENGRATKPKQLSNYLKHKVKSIGRAPICHIKMRDMESKQKLENLLLEQKFLFNEGYGTVDRDPTIEVYVAYYKWFNHGN